MRYDKSPLPPQKTDTHYVPACRIQGWERFGVPHPAPPLLFLTYRKQKRVMTVVTKLMTLNINGITNRTRMGMLTEYIRRHDLDIVFLQGITDPELLTMRGYDRYYNIGSHRRGTAIVARNDIALTTINKIPSGRTIAAEYLGLRIVIIYAPSGTAIRAERENFYNAELPQLLQTGHWELITGGDFNCVTDSTDTSGNSCTNRALTETIRGLHLADPWTQDPTRPAYTPLLYCLQ